MQISDLGGTKGLPGRFPLKDRVDDSFAFICLYFSRFFKFAGVEIVA